MWFLAWTLAVFLTFPLWMPFLEQLFGNAGFAVGSVFWASHGFVMMFLFRCPDCGLSPFRSNKGFIGWSMPWPHKICGHCGHDHALES